MTKEELMLKAILSKLDEREKSWVRRWHDDATKFYELLDPVSESPEVKVDGETYFVRRLTLVNSFDGEVYYEYEVYKWDKTYKEVPLAPNSKETFKWKNWVEICRITATEKKPAIELIRKVLDEKSDLGKEN